MSEHSNTPPPPYPGSPEEKGNQGYPPTDGYYPPPQQPEYYPPQGGYAPPQAGYPPLLASYPPPQGDYPPPQGGYPPPPGYPPLQAGYPPPQAGYPPYTPPQAKTATVVINEPRLTLIKKFGPATERCMCPHCKADVLTAIHYEPGPFSWVVCFILCIVGCDLGCCLIPLCVEGCQDVIHTCPNCHQKIGRWKR
ncbi:cell death-inducing p53-target protein 1 homolog [Physella acuta]|uniref:cell death-inducing p53-target protein 1 homolog n=1 Tax=Physella acuta TaxID=109671 RepID=UPI0027DB8D6F|nr:cell death-inducing p53-target protein 1 homolog [Physella acuta]XP_059160380.1 cell death-inducing p53-target protein 1 homolog [Physella acuta]